MKIARLCGCLTKSTSKCPNLKFHDFKDNVTMKPKKPWTAERKPYVSPKDPIFYQEDIICGGLRVARVVGVGPEQCEEHRQKIIRAVNSHDDLLSAANKAMVEISKDWESCGLQTGEECKGAGCYVGAHRAIVMLEAAIKKAEGK